MRHGRSGCRPSKGRVRALAGAAALMAVIWTAPAAASVGGPPVASTGRTTAVSYGSATLNGTVAPTGSVTSYYFQYGTTKAYGAQTPLGQITALSVGHAATGVSAAITGLQPLTTYHYRLIAVNSVGTSTGTDRVFKTTKVPLSLAILASPNPVLYGGTATIQGTLSGTDNSNRAVVLQENPFPYTAGFQNVGNPELTTAQGGFSFLSAGLTQATQFRVITANTKPPVVSPIAIEGVAVQVTAHVRPTHRRHHARIYGTVTPAIDGMEVAIMRVIGGRERLVAGTVLRHNTATSSRFSRVIRIHRHALYRVFVKVTNGAQTSNYSEPLLIR